MFCLMLIQPIVLLAQSNNGINYQAVIRDNSGNIISNQAITANFKIRQTSAIGTTVYEENHTPTTNDYGLINVVIGEGTSVSGVFDDIDWGDDVYFLDITLAGNALGAMEFKSVPYAHHANAMTHIRPDTPQGDIDITSDDEYAELRISPSANNFNDSTSIVFGEGFEHEYSMRLTYDGSTNELQVTGSNTTNSYIGPHLRINRDSGTSTFKQGVVVEETTTDPEPNTHYGNSGPLAYGYISGFSSIETDFGIASVTSPSTGVYQVTLDNDWVGYPVVTANSFNFSSDTETITYSDTGTNQITFRIVDENNNPITSDFSFVVYGTAAP